MMEMVVTTGAITRAKLQSNHHHQQTNTQLSTGQMPFHVSQPAAQKRDCLYYNNGCKYVASPYSAWCNTSLLASEDSAAVQRMS